MGITFKKKSGTNKSFLKKLSDRQKNATSLKFQLHKKMAGWEPARDHSLVHASDITKDDFCPRQFALLDLTEKKPKGGFVGTSLRATFDLGHALQDLLNTDWGLEWCVGTWRCQVCGELHRFQKHPGKCVLCRHDLLVYEEEQFISPGNGFSGSVDYFFDEGSSPYVLTEVKTMVKDQFKTLKAPLAEHLVRTTVYLRLVAEANDWRTYKINLDTASVLYICKGFGCADPSLKEYGIADAPFSPFKEFTVKRNDALVEPYVQKAQAVQIFRNSGKMPDRVCSISSCKMAKNCPVKKQCWQAGGYNG